MNCETCEARKTDLQTGDEYCKELGALISPGAVKCPRQQAKKRWPVGGVDRTGKTDKISLENAVETPFWMAIWATEPERMVAVEMSYSDLKILCDLIDEKRKDKWIPVERKLPENADYILLSFANFSLPMIGRYEEDPEGGAFYLGDCDEEDTCISMNLFVNAWRPLPDPYLPEKDK